MEDLGFLFRLTVSIKCSIESGENLRLSLERFLLKDHSLSSENVKEWLLSQLGTKDVIKFNSTPYQVFFDLIALGLSGHSILERLKSFEEELLILCQDQLERRAQKLPYELMLCMVIFLLPAYLLLILGPILAHFLKTLR